MKSLPFYIAEAWKRYPFWAELPSMSHYRGYPPPHRDARLIGIICFTSPGDGNIKKDVFSILRFVWSKLNLPDCSDNLNFQQSTRTFERIKQPVYVLWQIKQSLILQGAPLFASSTKLRKTGTVFQYYRLLKILTTFDLLFIYLFYEFYSF